MNELTKNFTAKIEEIFSGKKLPKKIAVAVSGGADSLALTLLLQEFCLAKKIKLFAATIDHKMRQASSEEARELSKILAKKKIPHEILTVEQKKLPQKNIEAGLRELRYELLTEFCKKNKIEFLFLGHHLGDVAENFLIRLFRGSGLDGLSPIGEVVSRKSLVVNRGKIQLIRPLLDFTKDDLKKFLTAQKIQWFEDETNQDEKFLRNKIRKFFESFEEQNLIQKRIKNAADEIAKMRDFFDEIVALEAAEIVESQADGSFLINHKKFQNLDEKIARRILVSILMKVGGKIYKPRLEKLKNFYEYLRGDEIKLRNFYGCSAKKFDAERVVIFAEKLSEN
jgi:tRNA(Ile)-lysidine synthase